MHPDPLPSRLAVVAAHRFGLGEAEAATVGIDPQAWVAAQFDPAHTPPALDATGLLDTVAAGALGRRALAQGAGDAAEQARIDARRALRSAGLKAWERLWQRQVTSTHPVAERWVAFWTNHFCVSATRATAAPLVLPFEREAIRPHAFGRFETLLRSASLHPAMLLYLDNAQSIGPNSRAGLRRTRGLNENQARELLELHTLGVDAGYGQADVAQAARLLTGWTVSRRDEPMATQFVAALHEPGGKSVFGRRYAEGPDAVAALFVDLARHPATARHLSRRIAAHFVADDPPGELVSALAERWLATGGDLRAVATALFAHPLAWSGAPAKLRRPDEWLLAAHRVCGATAAPGERGAAALGLTLAQMGQAPGRAPSPQGWADRAEDWLGPDALLKRVQWAQRFSQRAGPTRRSDAAPAIDARQLASASLGPLLGDTTAREIARADSGAQAIALLLVSPEFLYR